MKSLASTLWIGNLMPDLLEDLIAFVYTTQKTDDKVCPTCGTQLEENDEGELECPTCDD